MRGLVYTLDNGRSAISCPLCGQAAAVDLVGDRLSVGCYATCPEERVVEALGEGGTDAVRLALRTRQSRDDPDPQASTLTQFSEIVARPVRWGWHLRIALSKITALSGRPKIGKGLLYSHLIAEVTRGTL